MELYKDIEELDTILNREDENKNTDEYLNVNTVMDAINNKIEEVHTLEAPYQTYPDATLKALQSKVMELSMEALEKIKDAKTKETIVLPSSELVSKEDVLEAVLQAEESINYHQEKLNKLLQENAEKFAQYLKDMNVSDDYARIMKEDYIKNGIVTDQMKSGIVSHVNDFLKEKHETEETRTMVKEFIEQQLNDLKTGLSQFERPLSSYSTYSMPIFLMKNVNISYIPLMSYKDTKEGLYHFARDYGIKSQMIDKIVEEGYTKENKEKIWRILQDNGIKLNTENSQKIIALFDQQFSEKVEKVRKELKKEENKETEEVIAKQAFTDICKNMSFSDHQIDELLNSVSVNNGKLQFADGTSMYQKLRKEIMPMQQKQITKNTTKEELNELIRQRQEFFQNIYQYRANVKKDPNQLILRKIIRTEKYQGNLQEQIEKSVVASNKHFLSKTKNRFFLEADLNINVGSIGKIKESDEVMEVTVEALEIYNPQTGKLERSRTPGVSFNQMIQENNIDPKSKLKFSITIQNKEGAFFTIKYPSRMFLLEEYQKEEKETRVK